MPTPLHAASAHLGGWDVVSAVRLDHINKNLKALHLLHGGDPFDYTWPGGALQIIHDGCRLLPSGAAQGMLLELNASIILSPADDGWCQTTCTVQVPFVPEWHREGATHHLVLGPDAPKRVNVLPESFRIIPGEYAFIIRMLLERHLHEHAWPVLAGFRLASYTPPAYGNGLLSLFQPAGGLDFCLTTHQTHTNLNVVGMTTLGGPASRTSYDLPDLIPPDATAVFCFRDSLFLTELLLPAFTAVFPGLDPAAAFKLSADERTATNVEVLEFRPMLLPEAAQAPAATVAGAPYVLPGNLTVSVDGGVIRVQYRNIALRWNAATTLHYSANFAYALRTIGERLQVCDCSDVPDRKVFFVQQTTTAPFADTAPALAPPLGAALKTVALERRAIEHWMHSTWAVPALPGHASLDPTTEAETFWLAEGDGWEHGASSRPVGQRYTADWTPAERQALAIPGATPAWLALVLDVTQQEGLIDLLPMAGSGLALFRSGLFIQPATTLRMALATGYNRHQLARASAALAVEGDADQWARVPFEPIGAGLVGLFNGVSKEVPIRDATLLDGCFRVAVELQEYRKPDGAKAFEQHETQTLLLLAAALSTHSESRHFIQSAFRGSLHTLQKIVEGSNLPSKERVEKEIYERYAYTLMNISRVATRLGYPVSHSELAAIDDVFNLENIRVFSQAAVQFRTMARGLHGIATEERLYQVRSKIRELIIGKDGTPEDGITEIGIAEINKCDLLGFAQALDGLVNSPLTPAIEKELIENLNQLRTHAQYVADAQKEVAKVLDDNHKALVMKIGQIERITHSPYQELLILALLSKHKHKATLLTSHHQALLDSLAHAELVINRVKAIELYCSDLQPTSETLSATYADIRKGVYMDIHDTSLKALKDLHTAATQPSKGNAALAPDTRQAVVDAATKHANNLLKAKKELAAHNVPPDVLNKASEEEINAWLAELREGMDNR